MKSNILLLITIISTILSGCNANKEENSTPDFLASNVDTTFKPGDDFFMYANNGWFRNNPIPDSDQSNGLWQLIRDTISAQIHEICENASLSKELTEGSNKQKIGDFYYSGMDSISINNNGIGALQPEFEMIDNIVDKKTLAETVAMIHMKSSAPFFNIYIGQDDKISSKYAIFLYQGGLSLPERSFYFDTDDRTVSIRKQYVEHLMRMYSLMKFDDERAESAAASTFRIETAIAQASRKLEDTRDPHLNYNKISLKEFSSQPSQFDWITFITELGVQNADTVIIGQPEFFKALDKQINENSLVDIKNYLKYHLIKGLANYLDDAVYNESFSFYSTSIRGIKEPKPRWKRVTDQTNNSLGELIGQVYVSEYLPKGTKEKLIEIGNTIKNVFAARIEKLDWMSGETKEKSLQKLSTIVMKVGYPDKWKDMSSLVIDRNSYVRNVLNTNVWEMNEMATKFGKPVDRNEWHMFPQTYNAYYNPSNNEIVVPGANIIVPGYERKLADDAILYSIIGGSTFGHEITHGFDDQGSKYDENGNLNSWWTESDSIKFYSKTKLIVEQYNQYVVVDNLTINGEFTQGENIADLGGIMMGYEAFKNTKQFKENQIISGLNPNERFFQGYALAWMINARPESLAAQIKSDVHSPAKFRVIGPLVNMPEFYSTYSIKEGDALYRTEHQRIQIW